MAWLCQSLDTIQLFQSAMPSASYAIAILKMPVNKSLYPDNWNNLALEVKEAAQWQCGCCGKRCYKPGVRPEHLTRSEWTANILQVHHRNHDPSQNQVSNLQAVCAACHLGLHRSRYSPVSPGQLKLF